jgi:hypothetical protein
MSDRGVAPVIVGITGKRDLGDNAEQVRAALRACFDLLDEHLGASRKILLSGLAEGTDSIAAQLALERSDWGVVGVLPFKLGLFEEDFAGSAAETLRSIADPDTGALSKAQRGKVIVLDPLLARGTDHALDDASLARTNGESNPDRRDHYEQVGLFIAERSALLIAVMPSSDEPKRDKDNLACDANGVPLRVGGTARIVDFRLRGPDRHSRQIVARSRELGAVSALDFPRTGPVWLIDLAAETGRDKVPLDTVQLWEEGHAEHAVSRGVFGKMAAALRWFFAPKPSHAGASGAISKREPGQSADLAEGLRLAVRIDALNRFAEEPRWQKRIAARLGNESDGDASALLRKARTALAVIQGRKKRDLVGVVMGLAVLFLAAVLALELHVEFHLAIWPYPLLFAVIVVIYAVARLRMLQQFSEDYRAVAEALRVQLAWWDAGLTGPRHRADRIYLRGTSGTLGLVRAAVRCLVDGALLEKSPPRPRPGAAERWIGDQIRYFEQRIASRQILISWIEEVFWFLFVGSVGMACSLLSGVTRTVGQLPDSPLLHWLPALAPAIWLGLFVFGRILSQMATHHRALRRVYQVLNAFTAFVAGLLLAVAAYQYFGPDVCVGPDVCHDHAHCDPGTGHKLVLIMTVISAAMAGALRFFTERLASEAELHSYREILGAFTRARKSLVGLVGEDAGTAKERERLLLDLGEAALQESESWIRAHRVRPLEPMH